MTIQLVHFLKSFDWFHLRVKQIVSEHGQNNNKKLRAAVFFSNNQTIRIRWRCWRSARGTRRRTETDATLEAFESVHIACTTAVDERHASASFDIEMPPVVTVTTRTSVHWQTTHNCTDRVRYNITRAINFNTHFINMSSQLIIFWLIWWLINY